MDMYVCPSDSVPLFKGGDGRDGGIGGIGGIVETSRGGERRPVFLVYDYVPSIGDTLQSVDSTTPCGTTTTTQQRRATSGSAPGPSLTLPPPCARCSFPGCLGYRAGANGRAWWDYVRCPGEQKPVASLGREHSPHGRIWARRGAWLPACMMVRACVRACLSLLCIWICIWHMHNGMLLSWRLAGVLARLFHRPQIRSLGRDRQIDAIPPRVLIRPTRGPSRSHRAKTRT